MIFELDNVELYFKDKRILNGIYLKSETGKVTGILGSNGSGKSCLLDIAFGNLNPKYKLVRINGQAITKPLYTNGNTKYLPQYNFTPNSLKLKTAFKKFDVSWEAFVNTFNSFSNFEKYSFKKLSGGERRLVEIYLILKSTSDIVFLDEPFSHLSPLHIEKVKQMILEEKNDKAIIISDHMYRHIIEMSDDIYLLKNGCTKKINNILELEDYKYLNEGSLT